MDYTSLNTVEKIARFTKEKIDTYRHYPSKKLEIASVLSPLFNEDADGWKIVTDMGKFRNGFTRILGVRGMRALKKLLYEINRDMYQAFDFGVED